MKNLLHLPLLVVSVLLAAGVASIVILPSPRLPVPAHPPGEELSARRAVLLLDSSPAGFDQRGSREEFNFAEVIYATILIDEVEPGERVLTFRWVNPRGGVQEICRREFTSPGGGYRAWSWLELRGEEWLPLPLGPIGPRRFLGRWRVEVELDGAFLARAGFTVR